MIKKKKRKKEKDDYYDTKFAINSEILVIRWY